MDNSQTPNGQLVGSFAHLVPVVLNHVAAMKRSKINPDPWAFVPAKRVFVPIDVWGSPVYWNGYVYFGSASPGYPDTMKAWAFNPSGNPELTGPISKTPAFSWPSPTPSVSANGTSNGIVWALDNSGTASSSAILHAYQATNLGVALYNSNQISVRDAA